MAITFDPAERRREQKRIASAKYRATHPDRWKATVERYRSANRSAINKKTAEYFEKLKTDTPEQLLYWAAKRRAKKEGLPFSITLDDVAIPSVCPVFGVPFERKHKYWAASIDKIDPQAGYVKGNVQVISMLANTMKSSASKSQLLEFADWIARTYAPDV